MDWDDASGRLQDSKKLMICEEKESSIYRNELGTQICGVYLVPTSARMKCDMAKLLIICFFFFDKFDMIWKWF